MTRTLAWLGAATLVLSASVPAFAGDPLKPYVVLMLDTSGSMDAPTGSGPPSCGGLDNRLNHARCAINKIVNSYGDMVFALGRFRETGGGTFTTTCDANGNIDGFGGDQCTSSGVDCNNCSCNGRTTNCSTDPDCTAALAGDSRGEMLTGLVDGDNLAASTWTDFACGTCAGQGASLANQPEIWGAGSWTPLGGFLASSHRYWQGLQATDTSIIWPAANPGFDPIRSDPTKTAFLPSGCDPSPACTVNCCAEQCRPYITIMLTDGDETCGGNAVPVAQAMLATTIDGRRYRIETKAIGFGVTPGDADIEAYAQAGGAPNGPGNEGFYANNEAELQLAISAILADAIKTEVCNNADDDCDTLVDEDFEPAKNDPCSNNRLGKCRVNGTNVCRADGTGLQCSAGQAACMSLSMGAACNVTNASGTLVPGTCQTSGPILVCQPTAAANEIPFGCNSIDDDCDGIVDEGVTGCSCSPQGEACDNDDDDCDTRIDEGITRPCGTGTCLGTETCVAGVFVNCTAQTPGTEVCNGLDDNCDGIRDGFTQGCSTMPPLPPENFPIDDPRNNPGHPSNLPIPQNICHAGTKTCPANIGPPNSFGACLSEQQPLTEVCNNLDDDCDNLIDEGTGGADCSTNCGTGLTVCVNGMIQCNSTTQPDDDTCDGNDDDCDMMIDEDWVCTTPPNCPCTMAGICNGVEACVNGSVVCNGAPIAQESCNCNDDDCDTAVDEGSLCPSGAICTTSCQCAFACAPGEFPCPLGKYCMNGFCIADPCFGVTCPDVSGMKQVCRPNGNAPECKNICDSTVTQCPGGQICVPSTGECKADDCSGFPERCAANQTCSCSTTPCVCVTNPCFGVTCPAGQYCVGGQCFDSCADLECPTGQRCRMGMCETDPCGHPCPFGQVCLEATGECRSDPCGGMPPCPVGQECDPQNAGTCKDSPCAGTMCPDPEREVCKEGTCFDKQDLLPDAGEEQRVTTGGGGGCSTSGRSGLAAVVILLLIGRRRRVVRR